MTDKLREAAQDALDLLDNDDRNCSMAAYILRVGLAEPAIKESLTVAEQEPVAYIRVSKSGDVMACAMTGDFYKLPENTLLYTAPPRREWVGLTDEDKTEIKKLVTYDQFETAGEYANRVQAATESKLKEKNT